MALLPKAIYKFNTIAIKIPTAFSAEMEKPILKIHMELHGYPNRLTLLKMTKLEDSPLSNFKTYYKDKAIKTVILTLKTNI